MHILKLLVQGDFVQNSSFQCQMHEITEMLTIISDLFLRVLKHSKTPVLPERNPYVLKYF